MKNLKPLFIEIAWLLGCIAISYTLFFIILGNFSLDINLHDTYFVFGNQLLLIWVATIFAFPLYFIKEIKHSFNRKIPFIIFLVLGFSLIALVIKASPLLYNAYSPANHGWTVYPPLSVVNKNNNILPDKGISNTFLTQANVLLTIQLLIIASMLFATYQYEKSKNK